jgi:hypothetical protein
VLAALARHAVLLRVARRGSMLIGRDLARQLKPMQVLERDLVWTARLLRRELGLLVPASVAVRITSAGRRERVPLATVLLVLRELAPSGRGTPSTSPSRHWRPCERAGPVSARTG